MKTGFLGLGDKQNATVTAEIMKSSYIVGENVTIRVTSDNRACIKDVEPIVVKFKLIARFNGFEILWKT